jgi:thymidylate synthase ThyX
MKFWHKINNNLFVIREKNLEDFRAVLSSKISRRLSLDDASNLNNNDIANFLLKNLCNYGHASIAEMSFPTIFIKNIGWVSSWILEDDPLFIGQEVSTRAVYKNILFPCIEFNNAFYQDFMFFKNIFDELKNNNINKKGYKFDNIRWALPGGFSSGVVLNMNSRILNRVICRIKSLKWFNKNIYKNISLGFNECCKYVSKSLKKKSKKYSKLWDKLDIINNIDPITLNTKPIEFDFSLFNLNKCLNFLTKKIFQKKEYLDKFFNYFGVIKIKIYCSLAAARDWHRHRSLMPWKLNLITKTNNQFFISPMYNIDFFNNKLSIFFKQNKILKKTIDYYDLYRLPMGTACLLEGIGYLPDIIYSLKLRSESDGANFEYKKQASYGLDVLYKKFFFN